MKQLRLLVALSIFSGSVAPAASLAADTAASGPRAASPAAGVHAPAAATLPAAAVGLAGELAAPKLEAAAPAAGSAETAAPAPAEEAVLIRADGALKQPAASSAASDAQAEAELIVAKPVVAQRIAEGRAAFRSPDAGSDDAVLIRADGALKPQTLKPAAKAAGDWTPITIVDRNGLERQLSYDPAVPAEPLYKVAWRFVTNLPDKVRRIARFRNRVNELVGSITDENLWWSLNRLKILETQEGILRKDNRSLVNEWKGAAQAMKTVQPADFDESSLEPESRMKLFKSAMDLEEPTLQYQYAFAQNLHNRLHRMSHFLGTTLQEHIIAVALKGKPNEMAIWSTEELRHGPFLERSYNMSRAAGQVPLVQAGEAPRLPKNDASYLALSGMANRSLAEVFAATAYMLLRANAKAGSGVDLSLEGLYRDEVYHYVIMATVNRFVFGQGRWQRLYRIIRHDYDYNPGKTLDSVIHRRSFMSPLVYLEFLYAILKLDKRIDDFIKKNVDAEKALDLIGPSYVTDAELEASIARGEQTRTKYFRMEQNPHLTQAQVEELERRLPKGWIEAKERKIKASDIGEVLSTYRSTLLKNPDYWMHRKGFQKVSQTPQSTVIERPLDGGKAKITLSFQPGRSPDVHIIGSTDKISGELRSDLDSMSMLQIGALMDAESLDVLQKLPELKGDLSYQEIMNRINKTKQYREAPIPVVQE